MVAVFGILLRRRWPLDATPRIEERRDRGDREDVTEGLARIGSALPRLKAAGGWNGDVNPESWRLAGNCGKGAALPGETQVSRDCGV